MTNLARLLQEKEKQYGGIITDVPRIKVSPHDPRTDEQLKTGGMIGGDRMSHHGYAESYARHLSHFLSSEKRLTIIEVGILTGVGLAVWCDLFPDARVIGLDIDLGHVEKNMENLKALGAFSYNKPELFEFDQFVVENQGNLKRILGEDKADVVIDDGFHSEESIMTTLRNLRPFLSNDSVYFVEDNDSVLGGIKTELPDALVEGSGELTVIRRT